MAPHQPMQLRHVRATFLALISYAGRAALDLDCDFHVFDVNIGDHVRGAMTMTGQMHRPGDI